MDTFAVLVEMRVRKPFVSTLKVKGNARRSSTSLKTLWFSRHSSIKEGTTYEDEAALSYE